MNRIKTADVFLCIIMVSVLVIGFSVIGLLADIKEMMLEVKPTVVQVINHRYPAAEFITIDGEKVIVEGRE